MKKKRGPNIVGNACIVQVAKDPGSLSVCFSSTISNLSVSLNQTSLALVQELLDAGVSGSSGFPPSRSSYTLFSISNGFHVTSTVSSKPSWYGSKAQYDQAKIALIGFALLSWYWLKFMQYSYISTASSYH